MDEILAESKSQNKKKAAIIICLIIIIVCLFILFNYYMGNKYPLKYAEVIKYNAEKYKLDPYLICAVIYTESGFSPDAISHAGAIGLMQLMPDTAKWISEKIEFKDFNNKDLFLPEINIELGCWYLKFLEERFPGNLKLITAAYNAGHNRVLKWLKDGELKEDANISDIPYEETKNYVNKINKAYKAYKVKYPNSFNDK